MNQPDKPESSKQMGLWALLALFMLMSVGIAIVAVKLFSKTGVGGKVLSLNSGAITPVNLAAHYDKSSSWNGASAWEVVPHGAAALGGVPFNVDGLLRLSGSGDSAKSYREKVEGIAVGKKFGRLHLLHLTGATGPADLPYARVVLRYADGSTASLPLVYGTHARHWHRSKYEYPSALSDPNSKVVWRGTHESTEKTLRLFKTTLENPKPDLDVATLDLVSENVAANAVILAMSVGPSNLPKPKDDPASLPEPEEPFEGEIKFTAVDSKDGKPVANVKLKISGTEATGSFRTPDAVTDAKGESILKHPGDSTRTMTVVASGDGIAMKTIRWGQTRGRDHPGRLHVSRRESGGDWRCGPGRNRTAGAQRENLHFGSRHSWHSNHPESATFYADCFDQRRQRALGVSQPAAGFQRPEHCGFASGLHRRPVFK